MMDSDENNHGFLPTSRMNIIDEVPEEQESVDEMDNKQKSVQEEILNTSEKENVVVDIGLCSPSPGKISRTYRSSRTSSPSIRRRSPAPFQQQLKFWQNQAATTSDSSTLREISSTARDGNDRESKIDQTVRPAASAQTPPPRPRRSRPRLPTHPSSTPPNRFSLFSLCRSPPDARTTNNFSPMTGSDNMSQSQVRTCKRANRSNANSVTDDLDNSVPIRMSAWPAAASPDSAPYIGPTELHRACHDASSVEELNKLYSMIYPQKPQNGVINTRRWARNPDSASLFSCAATRDSSGRLPLHVLSENHNLIMSNFDGCSDEYFGDKKTQLNDNTNAPIMSQKASSLNLHQVTHPFASSPFDATSAGKSSESHYELRLFARDFVLNLVHVHPTSMTVQDHEGCIPFTRIISEWIDHIHIQDGVVNRNSRRNGFYGPGRGSVLNESHISAQALHLQQAVTNSIHKSRAAISRAVNLNSPPFAIRQLSSRTRFSSSTSSMQYSASSKSLEAEFEKNANQSGFSADVKNSDEPCTTECDAELGTTNPAPSLSDRASTLPLGSSNANESTENISHATWSNESENRDKQCPPRIRITPHVEWCLHMLSSILEYLDEAKEDERLILLLSHHHTHSKTSSDGFVRTEKSRDQHNEGRPIPPPLLSSGEKLGGGRTTCAAISVAIVQNVASIPQFIKTLLLIEDDAERDRLFSLTVVRRVVLSNLSIGKWLTAMLASKNKKVAQRAVDYLHLLSTVSEEDKAGAPWTDAQSRTTKSIRMRQVELYEAVSQLDGLIPSMLALDERMVEQAATSKIVRRVLDKMISRPFTVGVVFFDMLFLAMLIITFRTSVHGYLNGYDPNDIIKYIYISNTSIFYFIIRELGKVVSLFMIAKEIFGLKHFWSFWNIVDVLSICMALSSTIIMRVCLTHGDCDLTVDGESRTKRACFAITTGLLWLRVLGLLKTINMQLATFVLAIVQITKDILWFLLILGVAVVSFAQMFYTLLIPGSCATNKNAGDNRQCSQAEYYLKVYTILLGDFGVFDREDFATIFSVILIIIFSFMVVIILLNVLIAIVSDSYEKCLLRSENLFGRARVVLLAELVSFQHLLRPSSDSADDSAEISIFRVLCQRDQNGKRNKGTMGSLIFFSLSTAVVFVWILGETLGSLYADRYVNYSFSITSIIVNIVLLIGIFKFLSEGASRVTANSSEEGTPSNRSNRISSACVDWYNNSIQKVMLRLLGTTEMKANFSKIGGIEDEWRGQVHHLQKEMIRLTGESAMRTKEEVQALQEDVKELDSRVKSDLKSLQQQIIESEARVMAEVRSSERRMETLITEGMNSIVTAISSGVDSRLHGL